LNVPEYNGDFRQLLRKGEWLVIGLLASEMVLFTAWYQYVRARETARMVAKHLGKRRGGNEAAYVSKENIAVSVNEEDKALSRTQQATSNDVRASEEQIELAPLGKEQ
jgi:hypothetical protein